MYASRGERVDVWRKCGRCGAQFLADAPAGALACSGHPGTLAGPPRRRYWTCCGFIALPCVVTVEDFYAAPGNSRGCVRCDHSEGAAVGMLPEGKQPDVYDSRAYIPETVSADAVEEVPSRDIYGRAATRFRVQPYAVAAMAAALTGATQRQNAAACAPGYVHKQVWPV